MSQTKSTTARRSASRVVVIRGNDGFIVLSENFSCIQTTWQRDLPVKRLP